MKSNSILKGVMVVALLMVTMFTMSLSADNSLNRISNNEYDSNNNVKSTEVYRNNSNILIPIYRYQYKYNSDNQVVEKNIQKWNGSSWANSYLVNLAYNGDLVSLSFMVWNNNSKKYTEYSNYDCDINFIQDNIK